MRALKLHGPQDLRLEEMPDPVPGEDDVILKIEAVGLCGSDMHYYKDGALGDQVPDEPFILGHEFAATVVDNNGIDQIPQNTLVAVEPGQSCSVCEFCREGHPNLCPDIVFCGTPPHHGALREYMAYPAHLLLPLPDPLTAEDGAMLEPLGVAIHSVNLGHVKPGDIVLVLGCGPIGLLTGNVAAECGASIVFAADPLAYRREMADKQYGLHALDPAQGPLQDQIQELVGNSQPDVVFEAAGAPESPEDAVQCCRPGGTVVMIGIPEKDEVFFKASAVRRKGLNLRWCRRMKHTYPRAVNGVLTGHFDVQSLVTHRVSLEDTPDAYRMVGNYSDNAVKAITCF